jgi:hypothetical protein
MMARKFPFKFDFDEDADPVDELHRLRVASSKHFKTVDALMDYCNSLPTVEEMLAELREEIAEEKAKAEAKAARPRKITAAKKPAPARRRKTAKRLAPA